MSRLTVPVRVGRIDRPLEFAQVRWDSPPGDIRAALREQVALAIRGSYPGLPVTIDDGRE